MLKGSLPFMADLMRQIPLPLRIDLMEVSSYGGTATESSGLVRIMKDLSASIADEDVLLVEDIIDTGLTLNYLVRYLRGKNPASLRICTLLDKPARRLVDIPVDYTGFEIPDQFVVGYGLDYGERYRNLRFVGVLRPEVYSAGRMMHSRSLGGGRRLALDRRASSLIVGCLLPWYTRGRRRRPAAGGLPGVRRIPRAWSSFLAGLGDAGAGRAPVRDGSAGPLARRPRPRLRDARGGRDRGRGPVDLGGPAGARGPAADGRVRLLDRRRRRRSCWRRAAFEISREPRRR